jgi:alpha-tubulin suppressor-like RCC1 family protein
MSVAGSVNQAVLIVCVLAMGCATEPSSVESPEYVVGLPAAAGGPLGEIDAGFLFTCALNRRGDPVCWGSDGFGELGDGTDAVPFKANPSTVLGDLRLRGISAGGGIVALGPPVFAGHACGVDRETGGAHCWGYGADGQLGNGSTADQHAPVAIAPGTTWLEVSAGARHTCGVDTSHRAHCWGLGDLGQRGDGTDTNALLPVPVSGGLEFASVSSGTFHSCGVTTDGRGYCWGLGTSGQLGQGGDFGESSNVPVAVEGRLRFESIAAGRLHSCGLTREGRAFCWGFGQFGNLGNGTTNLVQTTPVPVAGGLAFKQLVSGSDHSCGRTPAGIVHCWGWGAHGQLGDGNSSPVQATPVAVTSGTRFRSVTAGQSQTCASTEPGPAYCWGAGMAGQLGNGGTASHNVPTPVTTP